MTRLLSFGSQASRQESTRSDWSIGHWRISLCLHGSLKGHKKKRREEIPSRRKSSSISFFFNREFPWNPMELVSSKNTNSAVERVVYFFLLWRTIDHRIPCNASFVIVIYWLLPFWTADRRFPTERLLIFFYFRVTKRKKHGERRSFNVESEIYHAFNGMIYPTRLARWWWSTLKCVLQFWVSSETLRISAIWEQCRREKKNCNLRELLFPFPAIFGRISESIRCGRWQCRFTSNAKNSFVTSRSCR